MIVRDLPSFLDLLRRQDQLVEIDAPCDPILEIPEIHRRVIAAGGPALLFKNPKNADFPVVTNLFGSARRVHLAFGDRPLEFIKRTANLPHELMPPSIAKLWGMRDYVGQGMRLGLNHSRSGPVTDVVQTDPKLSRLPLLHTWQEDGGAFVTLPLVYTEHPDDGSSNLGMYRIQRYDDATTGMHIQIHRGGGVHFGIAEERGDDLPAVVHIGGPPALVLSAIAPLPENVPEILLASLLLGERLHRCDSPVQGHLPLIAGADFALIGQIKANQRRPEGPFGDHYGYYSLTHDYPVFELQALAHRKDAVLAATVVGKPRQEDFYIGDYLQDLLSPLFPLVMPGVRDLWSYGETGYHALAGAVVHERYPREAMVSAFRILGEGQLSLTKFLLVTNHAADPRDFKPFLECILERFDPSRDLYVFDKLSMDTLDYAGPAVNKGSKGVLAGVGPVIRDLPGAWSGELPRGTRDARVFCRGALVVEGPSYADDPAFAKVLSEWEGLTEWPLVVLVDDAKQATRSDPRFLWTTFTRFEPAADIHARPTIDRHHLAYQCPVVIDSRMKPNYPDELFCDPETAKTVDDRWAEYFPQGGVEMGDSDVANLD
jgi:UbiD family decarboxylase